MLAPPDQAVMDRAQADPVFWVKEALGDEPWDQQCNILRAVQAKSRVAIASCHGAGKSWLAARIAMWFLYNHCPSIVITTAPTGRQVVGILWKEIARAHRMAVYPLGGRLTTAKLSLDPDWWAWGFTARDYDSDRFQGFHEKDILVIADEASGVSLAIFDGIEGILSSENAKLLMIGNPTDPQGYFAQAFLKAKTAKFHISAFDTPNFTHFGITQKEIADGSWIHMVTGPLPAPWLVTPEWVADKYESWGPGSPWWDSRVLGKFPKEAEDTLIKGGWIEEAQLRELEEGLPSVLGVDVARTGSDESAIYNARGPVCRKVSTARGELTNVTAGRVVKALKDPGASRANVDVIGVGSGIVDFLQERGLPVEPINFAEAAYDSDRFANLKSELYWRVRDMFDPEITNKTIDIDPEDEALAAQAASIRWTLDSKGRIVIESKKDMAKRGVKSPDRLEALVYSYAGQPNAITGSINIGSPTRNRPWDV